MKEKPKGNNALSIKVLDFTFSIFGIIFFLPLIAIVSILILVIDKQNPFFIQERIGKDKKKFKIIKLRTMKHDAPHLPAHEINNTYITKLGSFLRKYKIDELPQLINVLKGEMSFVGPRPSIESEHKIIKYRELKNIYNYKPGITGLATINKIDMSKPTLVAKLDKITMANLNFCNYILIIIQTGIGKGFHDPAIKTMKKLKENES